MMAYPRESQEMVLDAHGQAFACFGGVPKRMACGNLETVVDAILLALLWSAFGLSGQLALRFLCRQRLFRARAGQIGFTRHPGRPVDPPLLAVALG